MGKKILLPILILIIIVTYFSVTILVQPKLKNILRVSEARPTPILNKENKVPTLSYNCVKGKSAFDLLKENAQNIAVREYSFGRLVASINGIENGVNDNYWTYLVEDKLATVSADNYQCQNMEKVEWKFGKEGGS